MAIQQMSEGSQLNSMQSEIGNILGQHRAEIDSKMLDSAFIHTADFQMLATRNDFNFVVGRRGTGKSALFSKLKDHIEKDNKVFLFTSVPEEHQMMSLRDAANFSPLDYNTLRASFRIAWRITLLLSILERLRKYYKFSSCSEHEPLSQAYQKSSSVIARNFGDTLYEVLCMGNSKIELNLRSPSELVKRYKLDILQSSVDKALGELGLKCHIMFDSLDEGWVPDQRATSIIGGLFAAVSDFSERSDNIHAVVFSRDGKSRSRHSNLHQFSGGQRFGRPGDLRHHAIR